jgi:hypothetical protein
VGGDATEDPPLEPSQALTRDRLRFVRTTRRSRMPTKRGDDAGGLDWNRPLSTRPVCASVTLRDGQGTATRRFRTHIDEQGLAALRPGGALSTREGKRA